MPYAKYRRYHITKSEIVIVIFFKDTYSFKSQDVTLFNSMTESLAKNELLKVKF